MPHMWKLQRTTVLLSKWNADRLDYEAASQVLSRNEPKYSLEEVEKHLFTAARSRHRKPRKIE